MAQKYSFSTQEVWENVEKYFENEEFEELKESPSYGFFMEQFRLRLTTKNNRRYSKHLLLLAAEIVNVSTSSYRRLRSFDTLALPSERLIRKLLSKSLS